MANVKFRDGLMYINGNEIPFDVLGYTTEEQEFGGDVFDRKICAYDAANSASFTCANVAPMSDKIYVALGVDANSAVSSIDDVRHSLNELGERIAKLENARNPSPIVTSGLRGALKTLQYKREVE